MFGALGDQITDLGFISTHSDNQGVCGDGLGKCYTHSYEIVADPEGASDRFGDLIARKIESPNPDAPSTIRIPYSRSESKYLTPQALLTALGQ